MNISDIQKYKKYVENGTYENIQLEKLADRYSQQEQESISYLSILFSSTRAETILRNSIPYKCIVDYGKSSKPPSSSESALTREIWTIHRDAIKAGDILEYTPNEDAHKVYLLLRTAETRNGYDLGIMQQCYSSLKWLNEDGFERETPFTLKTDTMSNYGVQDGRVISLGNERRQIIIQSNDDTKKLRKDRRFIFDNRAWKIISVDGLADGIITLTLEESLIDAANDNVELRICDYNIGSSSPITLTSSSIEILGSDTCKINRTQTYVTTQDVTWQLFGDDEISTTGLAIIENQSVDSCIIRGNNQYQYGFVKLKAASADGITMIKRIEIIGLI